MYLVKPKPKTEDALPQINYAAEISSGNQAAFAAFVKDKARYYYNVAYRVALNREAAEDAVQNAFIKLWEKRSSIQTDGNLNAWLYRVVVNMAINDKRRLKFAQLDENITGTEGLDEMEKADVSNKVEKILATLPPRQRAAMMMVYYDEMPQAEVAEIMGVKLKALESLLSRAKAELKERIK